MDGRRGLSDRPAGCPATVGDHAEVAERRDPKVSGDLNLQVLFGTEGHYAVDLLGRQTGVGQRRLAGLDGQLHRRSARVLGEFGGSDSDDCRPTSGSSAHALSPGRSPNTSSAVPDT